MRQTSLGSEKQIEFWANCNHRWNIKTGATRSGKTYMDYFLIPKRLLNGKGKEGHNVILGNTRETVRRNILIPMQNMYGANRISNIHSDNSCDMFGEKVFVLGADNIGHVDKIRGMSIKYCYGDEVTTWSKDLFDMLKSRLDKPYSCFDGTCNPDSPTHWFKEFLDSGADIYQQYYTIFDNPYLPDEFVENLCKEYEGTVYYSRYIQGEWSLAEGLVYPMYEEAICDEIPQEETEKMCFSIDYGTMNAFAMLLWEKKGKTWYATKGYYYSGRDTGIQKTDSEYLSDIERYFSDVIKSRKEKIRTIIDPSAASFIALLRKTDWAKVRKADNSVLDGIRETAVCLKLGKIKISSKIKEWAEEAGGYVWDDHSVEERPIKENDHCITGDMLVMTESGEKPISDLIGTTGRVWSCNTDTKQAELKRYSDCRLTQRNAEIYQITTEDGRIIKCTAEHPILTQRGYVMTKYLKESDMIIDIMD